MRLLLILSMVAAGICVSIQGPVNARLRLAVGSPVFSAAVSFFSGTLVLACVMATGALGGTGFEFSGFMDAPPWAFLGGALGTTFVLTAARLLRNSSRKHLTNAGVIRLTLSQRNLVFRRKC
jgi:bacterial/archaeal transporter family-2 protein